MKKNPNIPNRMNHQGEYLSTTKLYVASTLNIAQLPIIDPMSMRIPFILCAFITFNLSEINRKLTYKVKRGAVQYLRYIKNTIKSCCFSSYIA